MNIEGLTIYHAGPRFEHDCDVCTFLGCAQRVIYDGRTETREVIHYDMYLCKRCDGGSIVIRIGNKGHDYTSLMISIIPQMVVIGECQDVRLTTQLFVVGMHLALLKMIENS